MSQSSRSLEKVDGKKTYENQKNLPILPIPDLTETLERYLRIVKPLQSPDSQNATAKAVQDFGESGEGAKLQEMLKEYGEGKSNYIEEFWSDAYLVPECSPVLNLNPFFLLEEGPDNKNSSDQAGRAASLVFASMKFASLLYNETLHPDVVKGTPLCMSQFQHIFGSCRIPVQGDKDYVVTDPGSKHVVVMCRSQIYYFKALNEDGTVGIDEEGVKQVIQAVLSDSERLDARSATEGALGVLTTQERSKWALARQNLLAHSEHNRNTLDIIDSGLFVLVLDDFIPKNIHEAAANVLHGNYSLETDEKAGDFQVGTAVNRWYDKLQLIVMKDGSAGVNFEVRVAEKK
jgi:carnitine O-acetyltransferase